VGHLGHVDAVENSHIAEVLTECRIAPAAKAVYSTRGTAPNSFAPGVDNVGLWGGTTLDRPTKGPRHHKTSDEPDHGCDEGNVQDKADQLHYYEDNQRHYDRGDQLQCVHRILPEEKAFGPKTAPYALPQRKAIKSGQPAIASKPGSRTNVRLAH
jgi:hypothetical protein